MRQVGHSGSTKKNRLPMKQPILAAKVFELADQEVFALGQIVSGHTLKHLTAAGGVACVVAMLRARSMVATLGPAPPTTGRPSSAFKV